MREPTREEWKSWAAEIERPRLEAEREEARRESWRMIQMQMLGAYQMQTMFCPYCGRNYSGVGESWSGLAGALGGIASGVGGLYRASPD